MKNHLSVITSFIAVGIVAIIACQEDPNYVPSSCRWQDKAVDSLNDYLNASEGEETEEALQVTTSYLFFAFQARQREQRDGLELDCANSSTESLEESIQKMTISEENLR